MATKPTDDFTWATDANFAAGPASGNPTKVDPPGWPAVVQGYVPGEAVTAELVNKPLHNLGLWSGWLDAGASTGAADAHIVETDANGAAVLQQLAQKTRKTKTSSQVVVNNSTTLTDVTGLTGIVVVAGTYEVDLQMFYSVHQSADLKWSVIGPANNGDSVDFITVLDGDGTYGLGTASLWDDPNFIGAPVAAIGTYQVHATGLWTFTAGGSVKLQAAQNTAHASDLQFNKGSWLRLTPVA